MSEANRGPRVGIIMGSQSDLETMVNTSRAFEALKLEEGKDFEWGIKSVHRTLQRAVDYAQTAQERGLEVIIAGAGGSAHLPGIVASETLLPVLGVAITKSPDVMNPALGSMIRMPEGKPLATFQGESGAFNAGLFAARILSTHDVSLQVAYKDYESVLMEGVIVTDSHLHDVGGKAYVDEIASNAREVASGGYY